MKLVLPLLLTPLLPRGAAPGPEAVVRAFFAALNAHDVDRAVELLDDGYVFRDEAGTFSIPGEDVRPMLSWDAATRSRTDVTILEVRGDTVVVRLRETNAFLELLDVGPWVHRAKLVVVDGALGATIVAGAGELGSRVDRALEPVIAWARETRPDRLEGLVTETGLVYDGESARRWLELLREARAAGVLSRGDGSPP